MGCAAPVGGASLVGVDITKETVIQGVVARGGAPAAGTYVRLLDGQGEFTAEVQSSPEGEFRFFAAPGDWTLRALTRDGGHDVSVAAARGLNDVELVLPT